MSTHTVQDFENLNEVGTALSELLKAFKIYFDRLDLDFELLVKLFNIDTAVGKDLEDIGSLFAVRRRDSENEQDYRDRILDFVTDIISKAVIVDGIDIIAQETIGISPVVTEYPAFDFTGLTGKSGPGVLVDFTSAEIATNYEQFKEFRRIVLDFKLAGVPYFVGAIEFFSDLFSAGVTEADLTMILEGILGSSFYDRTNPVFPIAEWDTDKWGESTFDTYAYFVDWLEIGVPYFALSDIISVVTATLDYVKVAFDVPESITSFTALLDYIKVSFISETVSTVIDSLLGSSILYTPPNQVLSSVSASIGGLIEYFKTQIVSTFIADIDHLTVAFEASQIIGGWDKAEFDNASRFDIHSIRDIFSIGDILYPFADTFSASLTALLDYIKVAFDVESVSGFNANLSDGLIEYFKTEQVSPFIDDLYNGLIEYFKTETVSSIVDNLYNGLIEYYPSDTVSAFVDSVKSLLIDFDEKQIIGGWDKTEFDRNWFDIHSINDVFQIGNIVILVSDQVTPFTALLDYIKVAFDTPEIVTSFTALLDYIKVAFVSETVSPFIDDLSDGLIEYFKTESPFVGTSSGSSSYSIAFTIGTSLLDGDDTLGIANNLVITESYS